jgi:hypothetical protein
MKTNEGSAECSSGSTTWWLWLWPMPMPMPLKKILMPYSDMYDKLSKFTVYMIIDML